MMQTFVQLFHSQIGGQPVNTIRFARYHSPEHYHEGVGLEYHRALELVNGWNRYERTRGNTVVYWLEAGAPIPTIPSEIFDPRAADVNYAVGLCLTCKNPYARAQAPSLEATRALFQENSAILQNPCDACVQASRPR